MRMNSNWNHFFLIFGSFALWKKLEPTAPIRLADQNRPGYPSRQYRILQEKKKKDRHWRMYMRNIRSDPHDE